VEVRGGRSVITSNEGLWRPSTTCAITGGSEGKTRQGDEGEEEGDQREERRHGSREKGGGNSREDCPCRGIRGGIWQCNWQFRGSEGRGQRGGETRAQLRRVGWWAVPRPGSLRGKGERLISESVRGGAVIQGKWNRSVTRGEIGDGEGGNAERPVDRHN
jgi:hypothetical protein